jgi:ribosomal-protein-serine acetyltransferase
VEGLRRILPERIEGHGILLRRWVLDDAEALSRAVAESGDHLRPWMPWMAHEPSTSEQRRTRLVEWDRAWRSGGDVVLGIFVDGEVAGGCGLHRRLGPAGLEIGYWVHPSYVGHGVATAVARLLTDAAFSVPGITHVEIHADKANAASSAIARRLGFRFLGESPDERTAPAELGIDCGWRMDRSAWPRVAGGASGQTGRMNTDDDERSARDIEHGMEDEAAGMERRLDELGDHVQEAQKKAEHTRQHADLPGDEPVEDVASGAADRTTASDDPTSAVGNPEDADET